MTAENDISILICTLNRAASLKETLACLGRTKRDGILVEILLIDNGSTDETRAVVESAPLGVPLRYFIEPKRGKAHCLNRGLEAGGLGKLVAVLDDDMSPHPEWCKGVIAIAARWPAMDFFSGTTYVIWPPGEVPRWAKRPSLQGWAFSADPCGMHDRVLARGRTVTGNHWWFRPRVLAHGLRFQNLWAPESRFMLDLMGAGYGGVLGPDAVVGHRIQPSLLQEAVLRERASLVGRSFADFRLRPYRALLRWSCLFKRHPLVGRLYCQARLAQWCCRGFLAKQRQSMDDRIEQGLEAIRWCSYYRALLRIADEMEEYRIFSRSRQSGDPRQTQAQNGIPGHPRPES